MDTEVVKQKDILQEVKFTVNGQLHTVKPSSDITPEISLNSYLRNHVGLQGTKGMCYEGGCGACIVCVTIKHPITKEERTISVNSCLVSILSCNGWNINTIEAIGNRRSGYHPIQKTLAKYNGTQCGYCSGGMVMNMYALYESKDMLTMEEVENTFGGSLCRCTGYRPIMDAFKSLAADADPALLSKCPDIEDLRICAKTGKKCSGTCHPVGKKRICLKLEDNRNWYKVYSIDDIVELFQKVGDCSYILVSGNTGKGVYKMTNKPKYWIDISSVPDLISHYVDKNLNLGANVSLNDTITIMRTLFKENPEFWYLEKVCNHIDLVANVPVRNVGTLAGNLSIKHGHHEFPSDIFLLLDSIGAEFSIVVKNGLVVTKSLTEFLAFDMDKCVIKSISIPPLPKVKYLFESYKICPRAQNAHAYVNAAFLVEHDNFVVKSARLLFGGINPEFIHAQNTEAYLVGKNLTENSTLQGALQELNEEIKPDAILPDASVEFRKDLALALFYKFVLANVPMDQINPKYASGGTRLKREISCGKQEFDTDKSLYPLNEPINKIESLMQCSGEAEYINDMPAIPGELFGALVLAEAKPLSKITNIDATEALKIPGVVAFLDHKDIPGANNFSPPHLSLTEEQLFCTDKILYNGQPVGIIVANTHDKANEAAKMVKITVEETSEIPAFNINDVLRNKQMFRVTNAAQVAAKKKGDNVKHVIKGRFENGRQYHFTMETHTCICVPTDDGGLDMYPATQWLDHVQASAACALNIPMNKVNVVVKRLGGAYGAKIVRSSLVSTACAIAAYKLNKPVRLALPLVENMKVLGKRVPTIADYEAGVDEKGVIQYLKVIYYQDYGLSGCNEQVATYFPHFMHNLYMNDTWEINGFMVQTDMPGNSYCRAPGNTEAVALRECIMDHIATVIKKDSLEVRCLNIIPDHNNMTDLIKETLLWSEYENRKQQVDDFNSKNRWMKKGISFVLMDFPFALFSPYSVFMSIYAGDGTVSISHGGTECGQGIHTKVAQVCAHILNIQLDMISIKPTNSLNAPNNFCTAGSITSEAACYGTIQVCKKILKRLDPIRESMDNPTWQELVLQGFKEKVELSASYMFSPKSNVQRYPILGACVCELTCDILTGEHNIDRVDLMEDVGQSISPNIDVGQIEGAFVMGLGYYTSEQLIYDDKGKLLTNNTWTYKVPGVKDIPVDFRVKFKKNSTNPNGVLNSKATGEPPLCLSVAVPLAIRRALASARSDADAEADQFVPMQGPTTVEYKFQNSLNDYKKYSI